MLTPYNAMLLFQFVITIACAIAAMWCHVTDKPWHFWAYLSLFNLGTLGVLS